MQAGTQRWWGWPPGRSITVAAFIVVTGLTGPAAVVAARAPAPRPALSRMVAAGAKKFCMATFLNSDSRRC